MLYYQKKKQDAPFSPYAKGCFRVNTFNGRRNILCTVVCFAEFRLCNFFAKKQEIPDIRAWRCLAISAKDNILTNEAIRAQEVRVIGGDGTPIGIMNSREALELAYEKGLDLVLISPNAQPPVCKIMDYGKYRFDRDKREKEARKKQQNSELKEIQLSCTIDTHDFETKARHAHRFLKGGDKVRVVVRFRGRQMAHQNIGREILERFIEACAEYGSVDKPPVFEGRNLSVLILPLKK